MPPDVRELVLELATAVSFAAAVILFGIVGIIVWIYLGG